MPQCPDVLIIGAGVIGLTCAVRLAESGARVELIADQIPGRTSLAAGALWGPYLVEPRQQVREWALASYAQFAKLAQDPSNGVAMVAGIDASRTPGPPPEFTDLVPDLTTVGPGRLPDGFAVGVRYTAPLIDMPRYLEVLLERLHTAGGRVRTGHLDRLTEASALAPFVLNATGTGARDLVPDPSLYPIRGQLLVVENPGGITEWFSEDTGTSSELTHWYPHGDMLVLGGQAAAGEWSYAPDPAITRGILARCAAIEPSLDRARILGHRVGLRPTRPQVRLDTERIGRSMILHAYGHGGAGVTLSWGVAAQVAGIVLAL